MKTTLPRPRSSRLTFYFRKSFLVKNTACITALRIQVILSDGVVLYLNNRELLRSNMPSGKIANTTLVSFWKFYESKQRFEFPSDSRIQFFSGSFVIQHFPLLEDLYSSDSCRKKLFFPCGRKKLFCSRATCCWRVAGRNFF